MRRQIEAALMKHLPAWEAANPHRRDVGRAARLSVEVNHALAACAFGRMPRVHELAWQGIRLGPAGWYRFVRDSRLVERVTAQLKARMRPWQ
jgi:hypothetical protein